jgi:Mg-chelatase subunit ChlD
MKRPFLLPFLLLSVILHVYAFQNNSAILSESQVLIADFFQRYNTTKKVDLVFVLDRSGSVPKRGWDSMLDFVINLLEHFIVDPDNTRVAIVTFSTHYTVNYNGLNSLRENKCALFRQIQTYIEKLGLYGYTALYDALQAAKGILINSRPDSKKAIFILTDGNSNVGPPPVKAAHSILSLEWSSDWPEQDYGPQVEMYALPDFQLFQQLARSLHGGE